MNLNRFDISEHGDNKTKANAANSKIAEGFGQSPEERLYCAVIQQCVSDSIIDPSVIKDTPSNKKKIEDAIEARTSALVYLNGVMPHAVDCGVDATWIRFILSKLGLTQKSLA